MELNSLYKKTENFVINLFNDHPNSSLIFHNLTHTTTVVERTKEISGHYFLSESDMLVVYIAAWFHDTGYLFTDAEHHEIKSVELMKGFLSSYDIEDEIIELIADCIMATKLPRQHDTLLKQIICDADTYHLGTKEFKQSNKKVWQEYCKTGLTITENEWTEKAYALLSSHQFYTKYCKDLLEEKKQKNMKKLKNKLQYEQKEEVTDSLSDMAKDKTGLMSKGIQTMLRLTSQNHLHLSDMADQKANILISVNAIMISVILSVLLRKLEEAPYLTIPTLIFLAVAVVTIVIAITATRPKITTGTFTNQDVIDKKINLMFFGNFYKASFEEYDSAMRKMMQDTDYLYGSLIKDIYNLAVVLGRKYSLIRLAYNIFMIGIIISVIAFSIAVFFFHTATPNVTIVPTSGSPF